MRQRIGSIGDGRGDGRSGFADEAPRARGGEDVAGGDGGDVAGGDREDLRGGDREDVGARGGEDVAAGGRGFRWRGEHLVAQGWRISLVRARFEAPDGGCFERDVVRHPGAVAVVPVTGQGTAVLVRQYRGPVDQELLEVPAGTRDVAGEPPEQTAARELAEEVGLRAGHLEQLCRFYNTPGFCDEETVLYVASDLARCDTGRSGPEEQHLTVHEVDLRTVDQLLAGDTVRDGQSILGLLLARDWWLRHAQAHSRRAAGAPGDQDRSGGS